MTKINIIYDRNLICGFEMLGHAGYAKQGKPDIVCSALSATSQMTMNAILDWIGLGTKDIKRFFSDPQEGTLMFMLDDKYYNGLVTQQLLHSFDMYMELLEKSYPENVKKERRELNDYKDN